MRVISGGNYSYAYRKDRRDGKYAFTRSPGGLIHITEDTTFVGSNFMQEKPHTPVFIVAPGVRLVLEDVNAVNVTLPDELAPDDFSGNNAQVVPTGTGRFEGAVVLGQDGEPVVIEGLKTYDELLAMGTVVDARERKVNLLHECATCATATVALRKMIKSKARVGRVDGKWRLVRMKPIFRARRMDPDLCAADIAAIAEENDRALARLKPDQVIRVAAPDAPIAAAELGWWGKVKQFFGMGA